VSGSKTSRDFPIDVFGSKTSRDFPIDRKLLFCSWRYQLFWKKDLIWFCCVFNTTFNNILAISWRPVLVVEEAGVPGENHRSWASNW
jgi:hypothetical protein